MDEQMHQSDHPQSKPRPDADILADVEQALSKVDVLRLSLPMMQVTVHEGVVTLAGYIVNRIHVSLARDAVRRVRGVRAVEDALAVDDELTIDVAQALARDERTRPCQVFVDVRFGVARLSGEVPSHGVRAAAEAIARAVPKIRDVENQLTVSETMSAPGSGAAQRTAGREDMAVGASLT